MKKKLIALSLVVLMMAALFTGCGESAQGFYRIKTINGKTVYEHLVDANPNHTLTEWDIQQVLLKMSIDSLDDYITMDLQENYVAIGYGAFQNLAYGTWKQDGDSVTIGRLNGTLKDGLLTIKVDGYTYVLEQTEK